MSLRTHVHGCPLSVSPFCTYAQTGDFFTFVRTCTQTGKRGRWLGPLHCQASRWYSRAGGRWSGLTSRKCIGQHGGPGDEPLGGALLCVFLLRIGHLPAWGDVESYTLYRI